MNEQQIQAVKLAARMILETVQEMGGDGAPSGIVYAALNAHGMSLMTYQSIIDSMKRQGLIREEYNVLYAVEV